MASLAPSSSSGKSSRVHVFPAYWTYDVQTSQSGSLGISTSCGPYGLLSEALAEAVQQATYYLLSCGYEVTVELKQLCSDCHGDGTVEGKRGPKRCPSCRGANSQTVGPFPFTLHPNTADDLAGALPALAK